MQGKGIVRFFLILLTIVCSLQYLYLFPTRKVEKNADRYAVAASANVTDESARHTAYKLARASYLDSVSSEPVVKIPLIGSFTYEKLKRQQIALGLDLKGGISTVLQVNLREFLVNLSNDSKEPAFKQALDNADAALKNAQSDYISLFGQEWAKVSNGLKLAPIFSRNPTMRESITFETNDTEVLRVLRTKANETVDLTFKRLKDRIDKLGVVQPNVSLDNTRDLIIVELPGVDNPERARSFLVNTAKLEFWDVYWFSDPGLMESIYKVDERLTKLASGDTSTVSAIDTTTRLDTIWKPVLDSLGNITGDSTMSVERVLATPDTTSTEGAGKLLSVLSVNSSNGQSIQYPRPVVGVANRNKINSINNMLKDERVRNLLPQDAKFLWSKKPMVNADGIETDQYYLYAIRTKRGSDKAPLEGDRIITATSSPDPMTSEVVVTLRMDNQGSKIWADMTTKAAQDNNREIAIVLDSAVVSAPTVNEAITTGSSRISGGFSIIEGQDLANILQIGKLPASTTIVHEALVGPSLGKENVQKSLVTMIIAMILVILFMIFYYAGAGVFAIIALLANLFFIFGSLSSLGTVLTLPGIAGIVLTIGMAVDANVIIYERAREELRAGKSLKNAISDGFKHSYSAIIDANMTTILSALALAYWGIGPIKGFAVTLLIGIVFSFFTAVIVGRLIIEWWISKGRNVNFSIDMTKDAFSKINVDWLGKRKIAYVFSSVFILIGFISMFTRGFELGVDFKGGYSVNVQFAKEAQVDVEELRKALATSLGGAPIVKAVDVANTYNITTSYLINDNSSDVLSRVVEKIHEGVNAVSGGNLRIEDFKQTDFSGTHISASTKVGPTIADDIKKSSFKAGIFALAAIFIYILIRFNKWQYSLGAVLATFHDALVVLSAFTLLKGIMPFSMEVDQTFIAAILTVIGYSLNDTVVIFDRIRENFGLYTGKTKSEILNLSINQTMSRTIITSLTVLLVVVSLLIFGGSSIKGFAFAMTIGLISGTYSTIFIAAPILADLTGEIKPKSTSTHSFKKTASIK